MQALAIHRAEPLDGNYRAAGEVPALVIERVGPTPRRTHLWVAAFPFTIAAVVVGVARAFHSPAILGAGLGFVGVGLLLVLLTFALGRRARSFVAVDKQRVRARCGGALLDVPRADVLDLGLGEDGASRTLWL